MITRKRLKVTLYVYCLVCILHVQTFRLYHDRNHRLSFYFSQYTVLNISTAFLLLVASTAVWLQ